MKIYTKTGDDGTTGLLGNRRVFKDDLRIDAYGTIDELNALLGLARASGPDPDTDQWLARVQNDLFEVGSALADPDPSGRYHDAITPGHSAALERQIDAWETELPKLAQFILPGGSVCASQLHLARTVCRRAERLIVGLSRESEQHVPEALLIYLNRLSDALFVAARFVNLKAGLADVPWRSVEPISARLDGSDTP